MKIAVLWSDQNVPDIDRWVEYKPKRAAYMDDEFIPTLKPILAHPYLDNGGRKRILIVLIESLFYTIPYIAAQEGSTYVLKSLVRLKPVDLRDFTIEIFYNEGEYLNHLAQYGANVIHLDDKLELERRTTDPAVELFYYPKEIIETIENY